MALVDSLLAGFQQAQLAANAANEARFQQGLQLFDQIISQFQEGGAYSAAVEAALAQGEKRSTAQGMQSLVSSGLSGTTTAATLGRQFQEEVGTPARLAAEADRQRSLASALGQKAGFIERREDVGPSFSDISGLAQSVGQGQAISRAPVASTATDRGKPLGWDKDLAYEASSRSYIAAQKSPVSTAKPAGQKTPEQRSREFWAANAAKPIKQEPVLSRSELESGLTVTPGTKKNVGKVLAKEYFRYS